MPWHVLPLPEVLNFIKKEVEGIENKQGMDAIKVNWHNNKNELFVNDFNEKFLERKKDGAIFILNLLERNKSN